MNKFLKIFSLLAAVAAVGYGISGCSSSTSPTATGSAPTGVTVVGTSPTAITVSWTRGSGDVTNDTVIAINTSGFGDTLIEAAPNATASMTLPTANTIYSIVVHSAGGPSATATWDAFPGPSAVEMNSLSPTSIGVRWTMGAGDPLGATVSATPMAGGATITAVAAAGTSTATLTGLVANAIYSISVKGAGLGSAASAWSGAVRSAKVRLYESDDPSSTDPSGLCLTPGNVTAYPTSASAGYQDSIDVVLWTDPSSASGVTLVCAGTQGSGISPSLPGVRLGHFGDQPEEVNGGLDADYYSSGLNSLFNLDATVSQIPQSVGTDDMIYLFRTSTNNYVRLDLLNQGNNWVYNTNGSGYVYVDIVVSEQSVPNQPYAARGQRNTNGASIPTLAPKKMN